MTGTTIFQESLNENRLEQTENVTAERDASSFDPFFLEGWQEFVNSKWGLRPLRLEFVDGEGLPRLDVVLYQNRQGRLCHPPLVPYTALYFQSTPTQKVHRQTSQWMKLSSHLISTFKEYGLKYPLTLPPEITDVRPWQWAGYKIGVRYTYQVNLTQGYQMENKDIQRKINKASKEGFVCETTANFRDIIACLEATEQRKGFVHNITADDLERVHRLLGVNHCLCYAAYTPEGELASTAIVLAVPEGKAYGWLAGSKKQYLNTGVVQLLYQYILDDLQTKHRMRLFDFVGANLPTVAQSKSEWGASLTPYYTVEQPSWRSFLHMAKALWQWNVD